MLHMSPSTDEETIEITVYENDDPRGTISVHLNLVRADRSRDTDEFIFSAGPRWRIKAILEDVMNTIDAHADSSLKVHSAEFHYGATGDI